MKQVTVETIQQLEEADWFAHVGEKDTEVAIVVDSWDEAIRHCSSIEWEDITLDASNANHALVLQASVARYNEWNAIAGSLKEIINPLVERKIRNMINEIKLPREFVDCVKWDLVGLGIECEYADLISPRFYASLGYWYMHGHFPCGWSGSFPGGNIIIY